MMMTTALIPFARGSFVDQAQVDVEATDTTDEAEAAQAGLEEEGAEALTAARIEQDDADRTFARDMADARTALRRDRLCQRRMFAQGPRCCRARARARRTRAVARVTAGKTTVSGDAPPGPSPGTSGPLPTQGAA
jgi:hypothetical protein